MTGSYTVRKGNRRSAEARSRLDTILEVARKRFAAQGYANTSLNDVVALAGGSKATVLKYFGNKAGLFAAVVADVSKQFVADAHLDGIRGTPAQVLQAYGETVLHFYLAADSTVAYRGVVAEGHRAPSMARAFYEQGHALVVAALADRLQAWHELGLLCSTSSLDDADLFLHLIRAGLYEQRLIGVRASPTQAEISARITRAVDVFLNGVGKAPPVPSSRPHSGR